MTLLGLLVALIVVCLVFWCVQQLTAAFNVPQPVRTVILVLLVVIVIVWLIGGLDGSLGSLRLR